MELFATVWKMECAANALAFVHYRSGKVINLVKGISSIDMEALKMRMLIRFEAMNLSH